MPSPSPAVSSLAASPARRVPSYMSNPGLPEWDSGEKRLSWYEERGRGQRHPPYFLGNPL